MSEIQAELTKYPVKTRVKLTGPMIVARDIAHAKLLSSLRPQERHQITSKTTLSIMLAQQTPDGMASGSLAQQQPDGWIPC